MRSFLLLFFLYPPTLSQVSPPKPSLRPNDILKELSWALKLKLLKDIPKETLTKDSYIKPQTNFMAEKGVAYKRNVGLEALKVAQRAQPGPYNSDDEQASDMRIKLFRLMYETLKDSDLKVKRAELIKEHYKNSTAFETGFLIGDITDKFSIITDIVVTLDRFNIEWRPIEHINAYEQITMKSVEISHLIDLLRVMSKKNYSSPAKGSAGHPGGANDSNANKEKAGNSGNADPSANSNAQNTSNTDTASSGGKAG